jgi:TRAP-type C4-dicarboxylate transport system substrate-binding protein
MKKKMLLIPLMLLLAVSLVAIGCSAPAPAPGPEPIKLKFVSCFFSDDALTWPVFPFIDKVNEQANGELIIEYVGGPEVISTFTQYEAVAEGRMDMGYSMGAFSAMLPAPFSMIAWTVNSAEGRASGAHDLWNEAHRGIGVELLSVAARGPGTAFYIFFKEKIEGAEDLVGLKVGDGTIVPSGMAGLGMIPTTVEYVEVYTALERGVIDGIAWLPGTAIGMKWYEPAPYMLDVPFGMLDATIFINLDKFNGLPQHLQELLGQVAEEQESYTDLHFREELGKELEQLKTKLGVEFIDFSPEDTELFLDTIYEDEWKAIIERYPEFGPKLKELAYASGEWVSTKW